MKEEYYSVTGRCCIKTQTALLLTLQYHLSDNEALTRQQLRRLFALSGDKLRTGFVGTPLLGNVLSANGMSDLAYELLLNEEYPGWLHEVKLGATTVWERWNSLLDDGKISGISMNSMNHYAYGSILEWMFRCVTGIDRREGVTGFREVDMVPVPNWELGSAEAHYDSPSGVYRCAWELTDRKHILLKVSVPFGGKAYLTLPYAPEGLEKNNSNAIFSHIEGNACVLEAGEYSVAYELTQAMGRVFTLDTIVRKLAVDEEIAAYLQSLFGMSSIPNQFLDYSIRQVAEKYPDTISKEALEKTEHFLQERSERG